MKYIKVAKFIFGMAEATTGGHTRCEKCNCTIKNEEYENLRGTNQKCNNCGHYIYLHDMYL